MFTELEEASEGALMCQGQGLMWGGLWTHPLLEQRARATEVFRAACQQEQILPYFVPVGGFMMTPVLDITDAQLLEVKLRLGRAVATTVRTMAWPVSDLGLHTPPQSLAIKLSLSLSASSEAKSRYKGPKVKDMNVEQHKIYSDIAATRTTGIKGPFGPWLSNPSIAEPAQTLGRVCRYETSLSLRESELVILMTARHHNSDTEWDIHVTEARKAGLEEHIIQSLLAISNNSDEACVLNQKSVSSGSEPRFVNDRDEVLYQFVKQLLKHSKVDDEVYWRTQEMFGDPGLVDITSIVGYYSYVALTLNVFEIKP